MMDHFYQSVDGCFTWPKFYSALAAELKLKGKTRGVELGLFKGQSLAYLAVELIRHGCDCVVDGVDLNVSEATINLKPVMGVIGVLRAERSWEAAKHYQDSSLDFVFIDANHKYPSVVQDIAAWRPKIKPGGLICGHDYSQDYPGVMLAVCEAFESWTVFRGERYPASSHLDPLGKQYYPVWSVRL